MSVFTVVIIIGVIYQLGISLMKKGKQQAPRNFSDPLKLPNGRSIREVMQEAGQGSWREQMLQMQQALQNSSRPAEEWTDHAEPLNSVRPNDDQVGYVQTEGTQGIEGIQGTEGTQGIEGTQGTEGTSAYEGMHVIEYGAEKSRVEEMPQGLLNDFKHPMTKKDLVQGVVWAEILGKPRSLHPFRGPRS